MNLERYEIEQVDEFTYRFWSTGPNGRFEMWVRFSYMGQGTFNLGFGATDTESGEVDDLVELRNGDSQKILATVAGTTLAFLESHPLVRVYATGSTRSRTRLYQMGINRVLPVLGDYQIAGYVAGREVTKDMGIHFPGLNGQWAPVRLGTAYDAFLIFKR
jgi:hypothetical protein